jgi:aminoglycoside 3-N-acetyltransferase
MNSREGQIVANSPTLVTVKSLIIDLTNLGVKPGMTLLVHSSLSKLGWVCGGSVAVILALQQVLGTEGTLVMPTHSGDLSDPAAWKNPPVPEDWWQTIYETMPAYRPDLTPTRAMGAIPETFRRMDGVLRSDHPQYSFAAVGVHAEFITKEHFLEHGLGEGSPLARVYDLDGYVLLLGVEHGNNTSLHLAETRANFPGKKNKQNGSPLFVDGVRKWTIFEEVDYAEEDFPQLGADFAKDTGMEIQGLLGQGESRLMPQRALVDYAVGWLEKNRK